MIKILVKTPRCPAHYQYVENELHALQKVVRGYIEAVPLNPSTCVLCNEEGRIKGLEHNCVIEGFDFVGRIAIVGIDGEDFTDFEATKEFKEKYPQLWRD